MTVIVTTSTGDGTCCCGGTPCVCGICFICKDVYRRAQRYPCAWIFEGSGFVDGNAACSVLNGNFRMLPTDQFITECSWTYTDAQKTIVWVFDHLITGRWELRITLTGQPTIVYGIVGPDWNCCGTNFPVILEEPPEGFCGGYGSIVLRPEFINNDCPCLPNPCVCLLDSCTYCNFVGQNYPCQWRMIGQGFVDGQLPCSRFNRNFILSLIPGITNVCAYAYYDETDVFVELETDQAFSVFILDLYLPTPASIRVATYELPAAQWNCCGTNVLNLTIDHNVCQIPNGVPTSITLEPVTPCTCGGGVPVACCGPCYTVTSLPRKWQFTIAGITNGFCQNCDQYNGTFILTSTYRCVWNDSRAVPPLCGGGPDPAALPLCKYYQTWTLTIEPLRVVLYPNFPGVVPPDYRPHYETSIQDWNCTGSNIMNFVSSPADCNTFPASITIISLPEMVPVCGCRPPFAVFAARWRLTLAGIEGCCAPLLNATHTLIQVDDCTWGVGTGACDGRITISLNFLTTPQGAITVEIGLPSYSEAIYEIATDSFNPLGNNVLTLRVPLLRCGGASQGVCSDFPNTIILIPD